MNILKSLHALLGRSQPAPTKIERVDPQAMRIDELPPFTLHTAELMRFDPQVRIGLGARNGLLMAAEVEITAADERLQAWVQHQWNALWHGSAHELLRAKLYGFQPFEVAYRQIASGPLAGLIEVERLVDVHPKEARLLMADDKLVGFEVESKLASGRRQPPDDFASLASSSQRSAHAPRSPARHLAPQALVVTFDAECANPYGCALLARAYPAWWEKWMPGGAKRTLRLRMIKDAYIGDILWYPQNQFVQTPDGREVSWRDMAREITQSRHSGGSMTLPLIRDSQGHKLLDYTPPQGVSGYTQIFQWKRDLDLEIWKAPKCRPKSSRRAAPAAATAAGGFRSRWLYLPCIKSWSK